MKRIILLTIWLVFLAWSISPAQEGQALIDTLVFVRPSAVDAYAAGDLVADSGDHYRYFSFDNVGSKLGSRGKIITVSAMLDTANATNTTVKVRFFTVSDTTGLWTKFCADNAVFQSFFQTSAGQFIWLGDVAITLTMYGTTDGGATCAEGTATAAIPYRLISTNGKLYCAVIATGAFTPKLYGKVRIIVGVERQS
jgi:hypothetical protein